METKPSVTDRLSAWISAEEAPPPEPVKQAVDYVEEEEAAEPVVQQAEAETPDAPEVATESEEEAVEIATLQDLAQHLNVDVADLYNIRLPVTGADGRQEISLGEWKDGFQEVAKVKKLEAEIQQQRQAFETERAQVQELLYRQAVETQAMLEAAEQSLLEDFQRVDWNALRAQNPGEYAAKQTEFQNRQRFIQQKRAEAGNKYVELQQQQAQEFHARQSELLQRESQMLVERIPEWRDPAKAEAEKASLRKYLVDMGYTQDDVSGVVDSRAIALARKAMLFDAMQSKAAAKKAVVKIGKRVLKPSSRDTTTPQAENIQKLRTQLRKSGSHKDAAALISKLI